MSNPWFRLYSEFADDPKVQSMTEVMQRRLVMLMCLRCKDETVDETLQAFHWRISPQEMAETKKLFLSKGFIDEDWDLLNWNRRQFLSDSSTGRVRQYRERKKRSETLQSKENSSDFDRDVTDGNVTVTAPDTDTEQKQSRAETEHTQNASADSAHRDGKKFALSLIGKLKDLEPSALGDLALEIAVRHPRSRLRNWTARNVGQADTVAILDAMQDEAEQTGTDMAEAGRMMLGLLDAWDEIPREKWQYVAAIPKFYKQGDYRLQPNELPGIDPQEGKKAHGKRSGRTDGNREALQRLLENGGEPGRDDTVSGETSDVDRYGAGDPSGCTRPGLEQGEDDGRLPCGDGQSEPSGVHTSLQQGAGRAAVLSATSYPPRIQWPRRNG